MDTNKLISSLCYFSIFFAGFIFPAIVYFVVDQAEVKYHAKQAFISHLIPFLTLLFLGFIPLFGMRETGFAFAGGIMVVFAIVNVGILIWNVVKGIKVLTAKDIGG